MLLAPDRRTVLQLVLCWTVVGTAPAAVASEMIALLEELVAQSAETAGLEPPEFGEELGPEADMEQVNDRLTKIEAMLEAIQESILGDQISVKTFFESAG